MIDFKAFFDKPEFVTWHQTFRAALDQRVDFKRHGDLKGWLDIVDSLPSIANEHKQLNQDTITLGLQNSLSLEQSEQLHQALFAAHVQRTKFLKRT